MVTSINLRNCQLIICLIVGISSSFSICSETKKENVTILSESVQSSTLIPIGISNQPLNYDQLVLMNSSPKPFKLSGFSNIYHWFRIDLKNETTVKEWFVLTKRFVDHGILMYSSPNGQVTKEESGNSIKPDKRSLRLRRHSFKLNLDQTEQSIYLGLRFGYASSLKNIDIVDKSGFDRAKLIETLFAGLYLGTASVLLIYNLFFYISKRDIAFILYEVFVVSSLFAVSLSATSFEAVFAEVFGPSPSIIRLSQPLVAASMMLFMYFFNDIKSLGRRSDYLFRIIIVSQISIVILGPWLSIESFGIFFQISMLSLIGVIYCTYIRAYRGDSSAKIYLFGLCATVFGFVLKELYHRGIIESDIIGSGGPIIGLMVEMISMSLAMGFRIRSEIESLFSDLQESRDNLADKVRLRTVELEKQNGLLHIEIKQHEKAKQKIHEQQEIIIESEKMSALGLMAAGMAHEINNPLTIVNGYSQQLRKQIARGQINPERMAITLSKVENNCKRISEIVSKMHTFSTDGKSATMKMENIKELINTIFETCNSQAKRRNPELKVEYICSAKHHEMICNSDLIFQAVEQLMLNAVDAALSSQIKWVRLELLDKNNDFIIKVTDSGPGIPEKNRPKIFNPFFTTKEESFSSGLGLAISNGITETHGGRLFLDESKVETTFILEIPNGLGISQSTQSHLAQ